MKKVLIGFSVLGVFIVYSLWVRHEQPAITPPQSLASSSSTNTPSGSTSANGTGTQDTSSGGNPPSGSGAGTTSGQYKDGTYTGSVTDAYYGNVEVSASISGGRITNVSFLQYPDTHSDSVMINRQAMPYLQQEAVQAQSAQVQIVSGATFTSQAFIQSLGVALSQAKS